jgi:hypothetical protein
LIPQGRSNHPFEDDHEIGQIWDIEFHRPAKIFPPHTEDIIVTKGKLIDFIPNVRISEIIPPYQGDAFGLYDGMIRFTGNGSGYISKRSGVPNYSTCFWSANKSLRRIKDGSNVYYHYSVDDLCGVKFKYVGLQEPVESIEVGTTIRMSLARWWAPHDADIEDRCYVQLSGWF